MMNDAQFAQKMFELLKSQREFFEKQMNFYEFVIRAFLEKTNSQDAQNQNQIISESIDQKFDESLEDDSYLYDGEEMELSYDSINDEQHVENTHQLYASKYAHMQKFLD